MTPPLFPAGEFVPEDGYGEARARELIAVIDEAPARLRGAVQGLTDSQLDTVYRAWSIRQIVHHVADSHLNSYIRFKWALTEDRPTIKAYHEGAWTALRDSVTGDVAPTLTLLDGLHRRWGHLLRTMTPEQYTRVFVHPETGAPVTLAAAVALYAWHGRHHTAQILWLRARHGWGDL
jgi:hypothetical protein